MMLSFNSNIFLKKNNYISFLKAQESNQGARREATPRKEVSIPQQSIKKSINVIPNTGPKQNKP